MLRRAIGHGAAATSSAPAGSRWKSTGIDEDNAKAYHVLGMALERMGHIHKALVTYERAFKLDPDDPELLINLGLIAWNLKQIEGAARMFSLYIQACPDSPLGYNNLGSVLCDMGDSERAIETLRAAIFPHAAGADPVERTGHRAGRGGPRRGEPDLLQRGPSASIPHSRGCTTISAMPMRIWAC
ncbi:MAG: tetratricopeptide repeat protein [Rhizomicrobium sp.]